MEVARALYFQSGLGSAYWGECAKTAIHLIDRTLTKFLQNKNPYEVLFQKKLDLSYLKSFGCLCYDSSSPIQRDKFMPISYPCVFIGYSFLEM